MIALLRGFGIEILGKAADMLETDAQPKQVTCQIYGHVVGACVECSMETEAQQVAVPMTIKELEKALNCAGSNDLVEIVKLAVEKHHGIGDKP